MSSLYRVPRIHTFQVAVKRTINKFKQRICHAYRPYSERMLNSFFKIIPSCHASV